MRRLITALMALAALTAAYLLVARPDIASPDATPPSPVPASALPAPAPATAHPPAATTVAPPATTDQRHEPPGTPVPATAAAAAGAEQSAAWARAMARAVGFMQAFARPPAGVADSTWWATVVSYLSPAAAADYAGTDPANVPFTTVTGPATVVPVEAPDELLIAVRVPTDAGDYLVEIQTTPTGQWVTRATEPASQ